MYKVTLELSENMKAILPIPYHSFEPGLLRRKRDAVGHGLDYVLRILEELSLAGIVGFTATPDLIVFEIAGPKLKHNAYIYVRIEPAFYITDQRDPVTVLDDLQLYIVNNDAQTKMHNYVTLGLYNRKGKKQ